MRLVEWLNGLPEVKRVLESEFEGRAIKDGNLTEWKNGGFKDWKAQQETLAVLQNLKADGEELAGAKIHVMGDVETVMLARYAAAIYGSTDDANEDPDVRLKRLSKSVRDFVRLRRCEFTRERIEMEREWLELQRVKNEKKKPPETAQVIESTEIQPCLSEEEKTELLKQLLLPKEEEGETESKEL